ncbi:hypothetical protein LX32DRAFT_650479 [Colletotrichum zoysiae]|uniref:Uncharacterized protein n=1 Tax=Colletotrichum zoysiae TaxID=1216348 RepID=A0AAD9M7G2_9PEZI|nr:hypothetical protein LX32DRAFT_650479 [Colletotrichum zoysiae]
MDTFSNSSKASSGNENLSLVTYRMPTTRSDRRPSITVSLQTDRLRSTTSFSVPAVALVGLSPLSAQTAAQQDRPARGATISKVSYGAGVSVDSRGEAYYHGGWLSNDSVWGTGPTVATTGLVKCTIDTNSFANNTGPDGIRCAEGSLQYIPADDGGMSIHFGGIQDLSANGTARGQPMDQIFICDVLGSGHTGIKSQYRAPLNLARQSAHLGPEVIGVRHDDGVSKGRHESHLSLDRSGLRDARARVLFFLCKTLQDFVGACNP